MIRHLIRIYIIPYLFSRVFKSGTHLIYIGRKNKFFSQRVDDFYAYIMLFLAAAGSKRYAKHYT